LKARIQGSNSRLEFKARIQGSNSRLEKFRVRRPVSIRHFIEGDEAFIIAAFTPSADAASAVTHR